MAQRLTDNVESNYIQAANRLRPKAARQRIVAYVESYDDIFFWRTILSQFEDEQRFFEVMLPSKKSLVRGKKSVLMNMVRKRMGENMIACVDADYDFLLQGSTEMSREVCNSKYVFHTYAYAIENMQCYAPSLHNVCRRDTQRSCQVRLHRFHASVFRSHLPALCLEHLALSSQYLR